MEENEPKRHQSSGKMLNWILALATTFVACGIGWVGWNCIESVQKNAGKLNNYHVTADNTKIDSQHLDVIKNQIDGKVLNDDLSPSEDFQAILVKQEGSELIFSKATAAIDKKQFAQAAADYSQILAMIPSEAKTKASWYANGATGDRGKYTMWVYRQRAFCYREMGDYARAVADLTEAIKLHPEITFNYQKRAEVYYLFGKKALGDADIQAVQAVSRRNLRHI
jgi:tetratricopeptide (TPR) repeat protein